MPPRTRPDPFTDDPAHGWDSAALDLDAYLDALGLTGPWTPRRPRSPPCTGRTPPRRPSPTPTSSSAARSPWTWPASRRSWSAAPAGGTATSTTSSSPRPWSASASG